MDQRPSGHLFARIAKSLPEPDYAAISRRVFTREQVRDHAKDNWVVYGGMVYDLTQYLQYHPGGKECVLLGEDITIYCYKEHPWVNVEVMLKKLVVGKLAGCSLYMIAEE